jgi:NAD(P)-dependent dehydrogenase (short-subunit alcohol dehydrogenase family)
MSAGKLEGRCGIVTGAGSGIGAATAARLRADGAILVPMSWQDRNRESYGVPVYIYSREPDP